MFSFCSRVVASTSSPLRSFSTSSVLASTKKGGGSSKNNRNSAGKRLGVKKYHGELVQPGSIITRQRGFQVHPGQHVAWGRDHTLTALIPGYVKFYRMPFDKTVGHISPNIPNCRPRGHDWDIPLPKTNKPKGWRSYVGVTLGKDDVLPRDEKALGRERVFFGRPLTAVDSTGVFDWTLDTDGEGQELPTGQGSFRQRRADKVVIPKTPGRVVNGEIVSAEGVAASTVEESSSSSASL